MSWFLFIAGLPAEILMKVGKGSRTPLNSLESCGNTDIRYPPTLKLRRASPPPVGLPTEVPHRGTKVGLPRFELGLNLPKRLVLPLHHSPASQTCFIFS